MPVKETIDIKVSCPQCGDVFSSPLEFYGITTSWKGRVYCDKCHITFKIDVEAYKKRIEVEVL